MEEKIKKVLTENLLYDDKDEFETMLNIDSGNQLENFFNTYKINSTNKQKIPENAVRDEKGRIILESIPFIRSNKFVKCYKNAWLILNNGTKLLVKAKREHKYNELELLIMCFIKSLNISCANYEIATYKDDEYLITPSFLRKYEKIISLPNVPKVDDTYEFYKQYGSEIHFLKTCFVDRIYGNIDRFPFNSGIIKSEKNEKRERICPLFDNVEKNSIFIREEKFNYPDFLFPYLQDRSSTSCSEMINHLLGYEEIMHWATGPLRKVNISKCADRLLNEKGIVIDDKTYKEAECFFKDSEIIINEELKNKGKSFKISLV